MPKVIDLTGKKFGRLTVLRQLPKDNRTDICWECLCECGKTTGIRGECLRYGTTRSCGCLKIENYASINVRHGHNRRGKRSRTYNIWTKIRERCLQPSNRAYPQYGGRGIHLCERWMEFENFLIDMGEAPADRSIERIDNSLGYYKENCKWGTREEQAQNRRSNRLNPELVRLILSSTETPKLLAPKINIPPGLISQVRRRKIWKNINP